MKNFNQCKVLYIGGPISLGGTLSFFEIEENLSKFFSVEKHLQALGFAIFNPARLPKYNRMGLQASQYDYLEQCFWMIMQSDGMLVLPEWELSHGTLREVLMAQSSGKPVFDSDFLPIKAITQVTLVKRETI